MNFDDWGKPQTEHPFSIPEMCNLLTERPSASLMDMFRLIFEPSHSGR